MVNDNEKKRKRKTNTFHKSPYEFNIINLKKNIIAVAIKS